MRLPMNYLGLGFLTKIDLEKKLQILIIFYSPKYYLGTLRSYEKKQVVHV